MRSEFIGVIVSVLLAGCAVIFAYGRNVQALTTLKDEVKELRATFANALSRLGRLEARDELEREWSGKHRDG